MDGRFYAQAAGEAGRGVGEEIRRRGEGARKDVDAMVSRHVERAKASGAARSEGAARRFVERMRSKIQERRARKEGRQVSEKPGNAVSRDLRPRQEVSAQVVERY